MIHLRYQETPDKIYYCDAEDNLPEGSTYDFRQWVFDNDFHGLALLGQTHLVYSPRLIKDYLRMRGIPFEEIVEDVVDAEIVRQVKGISKLEIMD